MRFHRGYALLALALFVVEIAIALWVHDRVLRPFGGDVLAVLLIYCMLRAVTRLPVAPAASCAIAVGFAVEGAQALRLIDRLGFGGNAVARTVAGTSFDPADLIAYLLGGALAVLLERARHA